LINFKRFLFFSKNTLKTLKGVDPVKQDLNPKTALINNFYFLLANVFILKYGFKS